MTLHDKIHLIRLKMKGGKAKMNFNEDFDVLFTKYTELLLGDSDPERKDKVMKWALYSHIAKSMPALVQHWNREFPEAKAEVKKMIEEIKQLNEEHRQKTKKD